MGRIFAVQVTADVAGRYIQATTAAQKDMRMILADAGTGGESLRGTVGHKGRTWGVRHPEQQVSHQVFQGGQYRLRLMITQGKRLNRRIGLGQRTVAQENQRRQMSLSLIFNAVFNLYHAMCLNGDGLMRFIECQNMHDVAEGIRGADRLLRQGQLPGKYALMRRFLRRQTQVLDTPLHCLVVAIVRVVLNAKFHCASRYV